MKYRVACLALTVLISTQQLLPADSSVELVHTNYRPTKGYHDNFRTPFIDQLNSREPSARPSKLKRIIALCGGVLLLSGAIVGISELTTLSSTSSITPTPSSCLPQVWISLVQARADSCAIDSCRNGFQLCDACWPSETDEASFPRVKARLRTVCPGTTTITLMRKEIGFCKTDKIPVCRPLEEAIQKFNATCNPLSAHERLKLKLSQLKAKRSCA